MAFKIRSHPTPLGRNEHGYDDLAAPMSVAVPFVYAPGAVAGREEEEEESARASAVLILGAATREAIE